MSRFKAKATERSTGWPYSGTTNIILGNESSRIALPHRQMISVGTPVNSPPGVNKPQPEKKRGRQTAKRTREKPEQADLVDETRRCPNEGIYPQDMTARCFCRAHFDGFSLGKCTVCEEEKATKVTEIMCLDHSCALTRRHLLCRSLHAACFQSAPTANTTRRAISAWTA